MPKQCLDSLGLNLGANPMRAYTTRQRSDNLEVGSGNLANCLLLTFQASYEIAENMFLDFTFTRRTYKTLLNGALPDATIISSGLRWNMGRREFIF